MPAQALAEVLAIEGLVDTPLRVIEATRDGIARKAVDSLAKALGISLGEISRCLHVSQRTLQRAKADDRLDADLSDHLVQLARVYTRAADVLGTSEAGASWLKEPSVPLGGASPLELLDTFTGIEVVLDELTRIEYGVVA